MMFHTLVRDLHTFVDGPLRVGLLDHDPEVGFDVHPECSKAVHVAGRMLEELGHHVEVAWPSTLDHLWEKAADPLGVVSDATRPYVLKWLENRLGRPIGSDELDPLFFEAAERASRRTEADLSKARMLMESALAPLHEWWSEWDLLVTPSTFQPAWPLGSQSGLVQMGTLLAPFSLSGQPSLSLPLYWGDDGLPTGTQLVGARGNDEMLLALAEQLQAAFDWAALRPPHC
jgi:amidase